MFHLFTDIFKAHHVSPKKVVIILEQYNQTIDQYVALKKFNENDAEYLLAKELKDVTTTFLNLLQFIDLVNPSTERNSEGR